MNIRTFGACAMTVAAALAGMQQARAEDWSDTSIGYRYGTDFKEPYVANGANIAKGIVDVQHVGGYKYGTNFFNLDVLMSNSTDNSATEAYLVYRNTVDLSKVTGKKYEFGPVRDLGLTAGFDLNTKNDPGYGSRKRMLVIGPTVVLNVPGFLNVSLLVLDESNQPAVGDTCNCRYTYRTHPDLNLVWGIPLGSSNFNFQGYFDWIGSKGSNEFGGATGPETHFDGALMYDLGPALHMAKNTFKVGFEYEYWRNKFGNPSNVPGSLAKTPMIRAEYHF